MRKLLFALPLLIVAILGVFLAMGIQPDRNPGIIPSALIGKQIPDFDLPAIEGLETGGLRSVDFEQVEDLQIVNFFASWCVPCRAEHKVLGDLARREGLPLLGVNYKDKPEDATRWLQQLGNPYAAIGADITGRVAINWGITGVPETLIVGAKGKVLYHHRGPVVNATAVTEFTDALKKARAQ